MRSYFQGLCAALRQADRMHKLAWRPRRRDWRRMNPVQREQMLRVRGIL